MLMLLSWVSLGVTICLILWSLMHGRMEDALYQLFLGSAVALLLRRSHEVREGEKKARAAAAQAETNQHES